MKIFVVHDGQGNIASLGAAGPDYEGEVALVSEPGQIVTEARAPAQRGRKRKKPRVCPSKKGTDAEVEDLIAVLEDCRLELRPGKLTRK